MKTKKIEVFIADDGEEFLTKPECEKYEKKVMSKIENIKYFKVCCNPDLTEGKGHYNTLYIAIYPEFKYNYLAVERVIDYMFENYGSMVAFVQGCSATSNWTLPREIFFEEFVEHPKRSDSFKRIILFPKNALCILSKAFNSIKYESGLYKTKE